MNDQSIEYAKVHNKVLVVFTVAFVGCIIQSVLQGWEYWVPPLIFLGIIVCWGLNISQFSTPTFRENVYMVVALFVGFYHGIHSSSFFDIVIVSIVLMAAIALTHRKIFLRLLLIEFIILMVMQIAAAIIYDTIRFDANVMIRIVLHMCAELGLYRILSVSIDNSIYDHEKLLLRDEEKETDRNDKENFLVNISHELRTPVNVINGMSTLILKKENRDDVISIRDAGLRLSRQIEDIQDYSEIERGDVKLNIDKYMITSMINDIIVEYNMRRDMKDIEIVIDLDPNIPAMLLGDVNKISKIVRHLMDNAIKFTHKGGVYIKFSGIRKDYGINLNIEVSDTGIGMSTKDIEKVSNGMYQANSKRNRSTGGIGLGLSIVYGFTRKMNGFVTLESQRKVGTTVRVSIAQEIVDPSPCLSVTNNRFINVVFHVASDKYPVTQMREFHRMMASNLAAGLRLNVYSASTLEELKYLVDKGDITHIFMGQEEYEADREYFDELAEEDITVALSVKNDYKTTPGSKVIVMPKPLYGYPAVKILNGETKSLQFVSDENEHRPVLDGVRALVVDDEPMNLVVATGLFKEYNMIVDTAQSGREAISKFTRNNYDIVFMDHMMPEMDGVETMKRLRDIAVEQDKIARVVALTANAISGAREMFLREGFDGFISKPININDFERTINKVLPNPASRRQGGVS